MILILGLFAAAAIEPGSVVHETEGDSFRMPPLSFLCDAPNALTPTVNGQMQLHFFKVGGSNYLRAVLTEPNRILLDDVVMSKVRTTEVPPSTSAYEISFNDRSGNGRAELKMTVPNGTSEAKVTLHRESETFANWNCHSVPAPPVPTPDWAKEAKQ